MRSILRSTTISLLCLTAPFCVQAGTHHSGFYAGIQSGITSSDFHHNTFVQADISGSNTTELQYSAFDNDGVRPVNGIHAGFEGQVRHVYMQVEAFLNLQSEQQYASAQVKDQITQGNGDVITSALSNSINANFSNVGYGLDLRPGFLINDDWLVHGVLGVASTKVDVHSSTIFALTEVNDEGVAVSSPDIGEVNITDKVHIIGPRFGLGVQHFVSDHMSVGLEYVYTAYGDKDISGKSLVFGANSGDEITSHNRLDFSTHQVFLRAEYIL